MSTSPQQTFDWCRYEATLRESTDSHTPWRMTIASDWAPINRFTDLIRESPTAVYGDLLPLFEASDCNLVNVEAVLCDPALEPIAKDGPCLRGDKSAAESLRAAHFHLACLANNHAMDFGPEGLRQTMDTLAGIGLPTVGAGMDTAAISAPALFTVKGTRVAIINCADGESGRSQRGEPGVHGLDTGAEVLRIQALRKDNLADVIIVIYHGGREYMPVPAPQVVKDMRLLAQAGADAVIAHHPHVPQGIEILNGVPIVYSQGNFVFWQENDSYFRHTGFLVHLDFSGGKLCALRLSPYFITPGGLRQMNTAEKAVFTERMNRANAPLRSMADIESCWAAFADRQDLSYFCTFWQERLAQISETSDAAAPAMKLHNRFFTHVHSLFACEVLERYAKGLRGTAPAEAVELVRFWLEQPLDQ